MTTLLIASGIGIAFIVGLAFVLPCPACRARRARLRDAIARQRANNSKAS